MSVVSETKFVAENTRKSCDTWKIMNDTFYSHQTCTDCFQLDGQVSDFYLESVLVFLQLVGAISCLVGGIFQLSNAG